MKKLLITAATIAALSTSALANDDNNAFYVVAEAGASFYNNTTLTVKANGQTVDFSDKLKTKNASAILGLGVGGYVMDNVRGDVVFNYFTDQEFKLKGDKETSLTTKAMSVLVNAYVDVVDVSAFKVFVGAGVGMANVKDQYKFQGLTGNGKPTNNFAYALYAGTSFNLNAGVDLVLKYSFRDNGKTKMKEFNVQGDKVEAGHTKYRSNNVTLGLRFEV